VKLKAGVFRVLCNLWPPLFFAGIKATYVSPDYREIRVTLKLRWYSRNYVGVQYGGSLMSMTDPWYMMMFLSNLGHDYFIWDKHAEIDYVSPGKSHVHAVFSLTQELLDEIKAKTAGGEKYLPTFVVEIRDNDGTLIARVKRTLYIKLKPRARSAE
jgi:acyl-coenzyme A thioesterase PaaI-like protein